MVFENHNSNSSPTPDVETIREGQKKLAQGDLSAALALFRIVLEHVDRKTNENLLLRIDACNGLIVRAAMKKKPGSVQRALQHLKSELNLQQGLNQEIRESIAAKINAVTETLGAMRAWVAVKKMSRLIFQIVTDETPDSLAHRIRALNNLGSALVAEQRFDDAAHIWRCAIDDHSERGKEICPAPLATIYNNLAELFRLEGRFPTSLKYHAQSLELRLNCFEKNHVLVRQSRFNLAQVQTDSYCFTEASEQVDAFLDSFTDNEKPSPEYLRAQTLKSRLLMETGRYLSAEKLVNQLARSLPEAGMGAGKLEVDVHLTRLDLAIRLNKPNIVQSESARLPLVLEQANLLHSVYEGRLKLLLGTIARNEGSEAELTKSEEYFQQAAKLFQSRLARNHPLIAQAIFQLAETFSKTMRQSRGHQTANNALVILEQTFGEPSLPLFVGLLEMTKIVLLQEHYKTARKFLKLAASNYQVNPTASAVFVLHFHELLRQTYVGLNKPAVAAYYARQAWKIASNLMEIPASQKSDVVEQALKLSQDVGHSRDAVVLLQRKIELLSEEFHFAHPTVTKATEQLGRLYAKLGEPDHAADQLSKVLTVRCSELGKESPLAIELMELTAKMHRECSQDDKAKEIEEQIQQLSQKSSHVLSDLF